MTAPAHTHAVTISLRDADAAGVLFFARYFALAHDAYEAFLDARGLSTGVILRERGYLLPVVHAEADYRAPLWVGDHAKIHVHVEEVRRRRFSMRFDLCGPDGGVSCVVRTVHVAVDKETKRSAPLAEEVLRALREE
jgi:1,4-dihydroxy-2-naphthoyl-CoA hydrolase